MIQKLQQLGFTRNHYALLGLSVVAFAVLVVSQSSIKLSAMFSKAEEPTAIMTYEEVRGQVYADMGVGAPDEYMKELETQFALLERGDVNGAVLGEVVGLGEIPSVDQLYSEEQLNTIPVKVSQASGREAVVSYTEKLLRIESYYDTVDMFAALNGTDMAVMEDTAKKADQIVNDMSQIDVPTELVDYHRYNVLYYQTLSKLGHAFVTNDSNLAQYSQALFSLVDRISATKTSLNSKYQISL